MEFESKAYLLLLVLLVPYIVWYFLSRRRRQAALTLASTRGLERAPKTWRVRMQHLPMVLRCLAFAAIVVALARPQSHNAWNNRTVEGIDVMLAMDVSTSMLAEDLKPNRIEAAKEVAAEFVNSRPNDNIGLCIFAGEAFTQCPMTTDHTSLLTLLADVRTDIAKRGLIDDGTAVGMGLATAVGRLKDSKTKSRVVILLTDGTNNAGDIPPLTAAEMARQVGVRVYTVAVGVSKTAPYPVEVAGTTQYVQVPSDVDTGTLSEIARMTGGGTYRAASKSQLKQIYRDIDQLEKSRMQVKSYARKYEKYQPWAIAAALLLLAELLLRFVVLRRLP